MHARACMYADISLDFILVLFFVQVEYTVQKRFEF